MSGPQGGGGQFNFTRGIEGHTDYVVWMLKTLRERGASIVDIAKEPEIAYAEHCREADISTRPLRDCLSYYNGDGNAEPGSLAYYGGAGKMARAPRGGAGVAGALCFRGAYRPRQQLVAVPRWQCGMGFIFVVASQACRSVGRADRRRGLGPRIILAERRRTG